LQFAGELVPRNCAGFMDIILGLSSFALGTAIYFYSHQYDDYLYDMVGGGAFPRLLAVIFIICGIVIVLEYFMKARKGRPPKARLPEEDTKPEENGGKTQTGGDNRLVIQSAVCILVYLLIMETVGYVVSTFLLSVSLLYLLKIRNWKKLLLYSGVNVAVLYLIFGVLLQVRLSSGSILI